MKITKFYNQWRVVENLDGDTIQHYSYTYDGAEAIRDAIIADKLLMLPSWASRGKSGREDALRKNSDLPVGMIDCDHTKSNKDGSIRRYQSIVLVSSVSGKPYRITRAYGINRTRSEAIEIIVKLGNEHAEKHKERRLQVWRDQLRKLG